MNNQLNKYKTQTQIMQEQDIYNKWTEFITDPKYKKYFTKDMKKTHQT